MKPRNRKLFREASNISLMKYLVFFFALLFSLGCKSDSPNNPIKNETPIKPGCEKTCKVKTIGDPKLIRNMIYERSLSTIGQHVKLNKESPHPYAGSSEKETITWTQTIKHPDKKSSYVSVHFEKFNLAKDDKLIVRSPDNSKRYEYTSTDNNRGSFWVNLIEDEEAKAIIEIESNNTTGDYGYKIDKIARGFTSSESKIFTSKKYLDGTWDITSIGDYALAENNNGSVNISFLENVIPEFNASMIDSLDCNSISVKAHIKNNAIEYFLISSSSTLCEYLGAIEEELKYNLQKTKYPILQYEGEVTLLDDDRKTTFILQEKK